MSKLIIRNGQVISPYATLNADVLIEGEKIVGITTPNTVQWEDAREIDASDCYVLPGVVDAHTHIQLDTGIFQTDDNWEIGTKSAAFGGVTTVVDFATQFEGQTLPEALNNRLEECQPAYIDYGLHMMITDLVRDEAQAAEDLAELRDLGVPSIKLYTTYKPNYYADDATILHTLRAMPDDMLALFHCENDDIVADASARLVEAGKIGWRYHGEARPAEAETEAALRVAHLAKGKPVYIVHCSSHKTVQQLSKWRAEQPKHIAQNFYFETCIQYLVLDAKLYAESDTPYHYILQPPLRHFGSHAEHPAFDVNAYHVWAYLKGETAVLSTDHCDYSLEKKTAKDDFRVTAGGLPGMETLLPLSYTVFSRNNFNRVTWLNKMVEVLCTNPAKLFGLYPQKGVLQAGSDADVVIYDPRPEVEIKQENLHTIGGYTPYEGMIVQGKVRTTISRGTILVDEGEFKGEQGRGKFLKGKPFRPLEEIL